MIDGVGVTEDVGDGLGGGMGIVGVGCASALFDPPHKNAHRRPAAAIGAIIHQGFGPVPVPPITGARGETQFSSQRTPGP